MTLASFSIRLSLVPTYLLCTPVSNHPRSNQGKTLERELRSHAKSYTYDLRTTFAVRGAGGCLTTKKGAWCGAVLARCGVFFVDLFHFLLLFLLLVNFINYFLLLKQG